MAPAPTPVDPFLNFLKPFDLPGWMFFALALVLATSVALLANGVHGEERQPVAKAVAAMMMYRNIMKQGT